MQPLLIMIHVLTAFSLIALVLLQRGKGADAGASFGSGGSNTMFGSQGPLPFLMKITYGLAGLFFVTSLVLNYLNARQVKSGGEVPSVLQGPAQAPVIMPSVIPEAPMTPQPATAPVANPSGQNQQNH